MLIYDLGGGTFDVTVARITPDEIVILSTAGDHDLGGKNWDDRIATFLSERFAAETGFRPARRPGGAQRSAGAQRAGQVGALRAVVDPDHASARHRTAHVRAEPDRVRGDDLPAHGPDPPADRGSTRRGRADLAAARRRALGRRLDADADGSHLCLADGRQAAARRGQRRRGCRARRGHPGGDRGGPVDRRRHAALHACSRRARRRPRPPSRGRTAPR